MKISEVAIYEYGLNLTSPLIIGLHTVAKRKGLIVRLRSKSGHVGFGEIAPLPGLSAEDLDLAGSQIASLRSLLLADGLPDELQGLSGGFDEWLGGKGLAPSVRFGIETAVLTLAASVKGVPLCRQICGSAPDSVTVNGLLIGPIDRVLHKAEQLLEAGYTAFKLKVGRSSVEEDLQVVRRVRHCIGDGAVLRLDANRAWGVKEAVAFCDAAGDIQIDYIEEPVRNLAMLERLIKGADFPLPVALDESLKELTPQALAAMPGVKAVILKPTCLGMENAVRFADAARSSAVTPVVSSSFESGIGLTALAHLAACINAAGVPAGLDTLDWFEEDLLADSPSVERGRINISRLPDVATAIRREMLREI